MTTQDEWNGLPEYRKTAKNITDAGLVSRVDVKKVLFFVHGRFLTFFCLQRFLF